MKPLLGSLLLAGVCWVEAAMKFPTMANFQSQKIVGHWYPVASILVDKQFPEYTIQDNGKGGLLYSYKYLHQGQCKKRSVRFTDQGSVGKFKTSTISIMQMLDTDYKTYIITYVTRGLESFMTLSAKEKILTPDLETKFGKLAASAGVSGEIVPMEPLEAC